MSRLKVTYKPQFEGAPVSNFDVNVFDAGSDVQLSDVQRITIVFTPEGMPFVRTVHSSGAMKRWDELELVQRTP